jgi:hypothetical protein
MSDFLTDWIDKGKIDLKGFFDWIKKSLAQAFAVQAIGSIGNWLNMPGVQAWAGNQGGNNMWLSMLGGGSGGSGNGSTLYKGYQGLSSLQSLYSYGSNALDWASSAWDWASGLYAGGESAAAITGLGSGITAGSYEASVASSSALSALYGGAGYSADMSLAAYEGAGYAADASIAAYEGAAQGAMAGVETGASSTAAADAAAGGAMTATSWTIIVAAIIFMAHQFSKWNAQKGYGQVGLTQVTDAFGGYLVNDPAGTFARGTVGIDEPAMSTYASYYLKHGDWTNFARVTPEAMMDWINPMGSFLADLFEDKGFLGDAGKWIAAPIKSTWGSIFGDGNTRSYVGRDYTGRYDKETGWDYSYNQYKKDIGEPIEYGDIRDAWKNVIEKFQENVNSVTDNMLKSLEFLGTQSTFQTYLQEHPVSTRTMISAETSKEFKKDFERSFKDMEAGVTQILVQGYNKAFKTGIDRLSNNEDWKRTFDLLTDNVKKGLMEALDNFTDATTFEDLQKNVEGFDKVIGYMNNVHAIVVDIENSFDLAGLTTTSKELDKVNETFFALAARLEDVGIAAKEVEGFEKAHTKTLKAIADAYKSGLTDILVGIGWEKGTNRDTLANDTVISTLTRLEQNRNKIGPQPGNAALGYFNEKYRAALQGNSLRSTQDLYNLIVTIRDLDAAKLRQLDDYLTDFDFNLDTLKADLALTASATATASETLRKLGEEVMNKFIAMVDATTLSWSRLENAMLNVDMAGLMQRLLNDAVAKAEKDGDFLPDFSGIGDQWAQGVGDMLKGTVLTEVNNTMFEGLKQGMIVPYMDMLTSGNFDIAAIEKLFNDINSVGPSLSNIGQGLAEFNGYILTYGNLEGFDWDAWNAKYGEDWARISASMKTTQDKQKEAAEELLEAAKDLKIAAADLSAIEGPPDVTVNVQSSSLEHDVGWGRV